MLGIQFFNEAYKYSIHMHRKMCHCWHWSEPETDPTEPYQYQYHTVCYVTVWQMMDIHKHNNNMLYTL